MTIKQTQPSIKQQGAMYIMIGKQLASSYVWWAMLLAFVVGLVLGWMALGWLIAPVQWTQARPVNLSVEAGTTKGYQPVFLNYAATTYGFNAAKMEDVAASMGEGWSLDAINTVLDTMIAQDYAGNKAYLTQFKTDLTAFVNAGGSLGPAGAPPNNAGVSPTAMLLLLAVVLIAAILIGWFIFRRLRSEAPSKQAKMAQDAAHAAEAGEAVVVPTISRAAGGARPVEKTPWPGESRPPLTQFATTYAFGDDRYDMSTPIETAGAEFLGECGVGISEFIGSGSPEKVTALEVWMFDKNDTRTITKVLMTEHAYNDAAIRNKLASKGDAVLVKKGDIVELKSPGLKINARVADLVYGGGSPANSYFQQLTLEVATWNDA